MKPKQPNRKKMQRKPNLSHVGRMKPVMDKQDPRIAEFDSHEPIECNPCDAQWFINVSVAVPQNIIGNADVGFSVDHLKTRNNLIEGVLTRGVELLDEAGKSAERQTVLASQENIRRIQDASNQIGFRMGVISTEKTGKQHADVLIEQSVIRWRLGIITTGIVPNSSGVVESFKSETIKAITDSYNQMMRDHGLPEVSEPYTG